MIGAKLPCRHRLIDKDTVAASDKDKLFTQMLHKRLNMELLPNPIATQLKRDLSTKLEPFVFELLGDEYYETAVVRADTLLTWNRLDLAFKLLYLELKEKHPELARTIYAHDIRSQTLGTYKEYGNPEKDSLTKYYHTFDEIYENIQSQGFDEKRSLVPLSATGALFNGSHRTASAIALGRKLSVVRTELPIHVCDYRFYLRNAVPNELVEMAVVKFIEQAPDVYLAFLWPSGASNLERSTAEFDNILYCCNLRLTANGARNLLFELYKHMDWIGSKKNGYSGIDQKLAECFPVDSNFRVIAFQAKSIEEVRSIKQRVRDVNGIGFSSVHITDTHEEATRLAALLFNKNGRHFLEFEKVGKVDISAKLQEFREVMRATQVDLKDVAIDGSFLLALYGLRSARDVDFLSLKQITSQSTDIEPHDDQIVYHRRNKNQIIYDPTYHFVYSGIKFVSFQQLFDMKSVRDENKDRYDIALMSRMTASPSSRKWVQNALQDVAFTRVRIKSALRRSLVLILRKLGLYDPVRRFYWKWMR